MTEIIEFDKKYSDLLVFDDQPKRQLKTVEETLYGSKCSHEYQPIYTSTSSNYEFLDGYRCYKCGAVFGKNCFRFLVKGGESYG